jgi:hypothetical protein
MGYSTAGTYTSWLLAKYSSLGALLWQKKLGGTANNNYGYGLAIDTSDNLYASGSGPASGGANYAAVAKYNTSGAVQWQRQIGSVPYFSSFNDAAVDGSGNVYAGGYQNASQFGSNYDFSLVKYNSSGTLQWQRYLGVTRNQVASGVVTDSSGTTYISGYHTVYNFGTEQNDFYGLIAKYNSSGAIQWQRTFIQVSSANANKMALDSEGNLYVAASAAGKFTLIKYNSSGTVLFANTLTPAVANIVANDVTVDSSNNVYLVGEGENYSAFICKYNSSGTLQWQRQITTDASVTYKYFRGIKVDSLGNMFMAGVMMTSSNNQYFFLGKFPSDGSKTGTYVVGGFSFVYAAATATTGTASLTVASSTLTEGATSLTSSTSTMTEANSSLTSSVTPL